METDYIGRQAALDFLIPAYDLNISPQDQRTIGDRFEEFLKSIPAANVRPVKEGHWVKARGSWCTPGGDPVWECSECGKGVHVYGIEHGTYGSDIADGQWVSCPNCGAMMGGVNRGTD